jgi:hypothetical protein
MVVSTADCGSEQDTAIFRLCLVGFVFSSVAEVVGSFGQFPLDEIASSFERDFFVFLVFRERLKVGVGYG